eukprot:scaffold94_cov254-Pinguiococcus_pyrenoidosus.AAC.9
MESQQLFSFVLSNGCPIGLRAVIPAPCENLDAPSNHCSPFVIAAFSNEPPQESSALQNGPFPNETLALLSTGRHIETP